MSSVFVFYALSAAITLCSLLVVGLKNPVSAAIALVVDLFLLAGMYAIQGAEFAAAIQVIVYAGAIVVLFVFVIMLLNLDSAALVEKRRPFFEYMSGFFVVVGFGALMCKLWPSVTGATIEDVFKGDNTKEVALVLFTKYLWPFELASILILVGIVASVTIVSKKRG